MLFFSKFSHFPLPLLRPLTTAKRAAILKKKAKSNSHWSVTITSETANLDQSECRKINSHQKIYTNSWYSYTICKYSARIVFWFVFNVVLFFIGQLLPRKLLIHLELCQCCCLEHLVINAILNRQKISTIKLSIYSPSADVWYLHAKL